MNRSDEWRENEHNLLNDDIEFVDESIENYTHNEDKEITEDEK